MNKVFCLVLLAALCLAGQPALAAGGKGVSRQRPAVKPPPLLFDRTQEIIRDIQQKSGGRLICYWNSENGSVCANDIIALNNLLSRLKPEEKATIFMKSGGGDVESALRLVHLIRHYFKDVTVLIPLECASAATMIALGANEIRMGPLAYLTAIDTSLVHELSPVDKNNQRVQVSQDELLRIVTLLGKTNNVNPYKEIFNHIHPLVVGAIDRASSLSIRLCTDILQYHIKNGAEAERISRHFNSNYPSHSYPITLKEAQGIGLNVKEIDPVVNEQLIALHMLYSEMAQKAITDFDERNYHNNEILNIIETVDAQIFYQNDVDLHYIVEERRWQPMNDQSAWHKLERSNGERRESILHLR